MTDHTRVSLDQAFAGRPTLDAGWSKRKKVVVAAASLTLAVGAVAGGAAYHLATRPPALPTSVDEAVAVLASDRFERLDEDRQRQYAAEAGRLLRDLPADQRRALFQDQATRDALAKVRQEMFDEIARRFARGEDLPTRPRRSDGAEGRPTFNPQDMTPEERAAMRERMIQRLNEQFAEAAESGNAQDSGLRAEMMKRREKQVRESGGRGGPGARRGG